MCDACMCAEQPTTPRPDPLVIRALVIVLKGQLGVDGDTYNQLMTEFPVEMGAIMDIYPLHTADDLFYIV